MGTFKNLAKIGKNFMPLNFEKVQEVHLWELVMWSKYECNGYYTKND